MTARVQYNLMQPLVCSEHFEHGPIMCCPFPDCANGTTDEKVEVALPGLHSETYCRFVWNGPDGEKFFSWEKDNDRATPSLMVNRVLWREARRHSYVRKLANGAIGRPIIYHYTSPDGLLGIIQSSTLWMTDFSYLNDVEEITYGLNLAKTRFETIAPQMPTVAELLARWTKSFEVIDERVCVSSFSHIGDSLSQWRAYGPIAVGFDVSGLMFGYNNSVHMESVVYNRADQVRLLDLLIHLCATAYNFDKTHLTPEHLDRVYEDDSGRILMLISLFKHPGFADERELRMVHVEHPKVLEGFGVPRPPQRFRVAGRLLVPYLTTRDIATFPDSYPEKLPIAEIVIGPNARGEILERGVKQLLSAHGYQETQVKRSIVPFRA